MSDTCLLIDDVFAIGIGGPLMSAVLGAHAMLVAGCRDGYSAGPKGTICAGAQPVQSVLEAVQQAEADDAPDHACTARLGIHTQGWHTVLIAALEAAAPAPVAYDTRATGHSVLRAFNKLW